MFRHLHLFATKGLKDCVLHELGKINVVCGKNNSGKSTVLEAIVEQRTCAHGLQFGQDEAETLAVACLHGKGWGENPDFDRRFRAIVVDVASSREIWYSNESQQFLSEIVARRTSDSQLRRWTFNENSITAAFGAQFPERPQVVLVPPKRNLELAKGIQAQDQAQPDGVGILNQLFLARNQPEDSEERRLYDRIGDHFTSISGGYSFDIFMNATNLVTLHFSLAGKPWVPSVACGLGLQDLLVLLWFSLAPPYGVILVEEPESHMHPEMQRKLLAFLVASTDKQFFLTTHSNVFVNSAYVDKVFFTFFSDSVQLSDATSRASVLRDIGYDVTDNLVSDLVILVEGPTDTPVIEELLIKKGLIPKYNIKIWPLGGDIMDQLDLTVFSQAFKIHALADSDPGSAAIRRRFIKRCEESGIPVHQLDRYSIENYFTYEALVSVLGTQIDTPIEDLDPHKRLQDQIGIDVKRNNRRIVQSMSLEDLRGNDLDDFLNKVALSCGEPAGD
jgi:hypothetical protein